MPFRNPENNENERRIKRIEDKLADVRAAMRDRIGKHLASIGGDSRFAFSQRHSGTWTPTGFDTPIKSDNIHVNTNHNSSDGTIRFTLGTDVPNPKYEKSPEFTQEKNTRVHLGTGIIYPDGRIDMLPKPAWTHTADGSMDERVIKFILADHLSAPVRHPQTGEIITVGQHHGLTSEIQESLSNKSYLIDDVMMHGENPNEYSQRLLRMINDNDFGSMDHHDRFHAYNAFMDSIRDQYEGRSLPPLIVRVMDGTSRNPNARAMRVTGISGKPTKAILRGIPASAGGHRSHHGKREEEQNARSVTGIVTSNYAFMKPQHIAVIRKIADFRGLREMLEPIMEEKKSKKPYKGFKKGKNHPEGGLSRSEARRQGIHAGIETKDEAKRKGGFGKLSKKTQKRRKSFCARMCGMKRRRTSSKTANDPKSKINAALRVWGCRCDTNESYESKIDLLIEAKKKMKNPCWKGYEAIGMKNKNGKKVPNCVPTSESSLNHIQFRVKDKFLTEGCGCGGKGKPKPKPKPIIKKPKNINEEIVNKKNKGSMTKSEIKGRDEVEKNLSGVEIVKKGDTMKNARYRLATYIKILQRGKKKSK